MKAPYTPGEVDERYRLIHPLDRKHWLCDCVDCGATGVKVHKIVLRSERKRRLAIVRTHFCRADQMGRIRRNFPLLAPYVTDVQPDRRSRKDGGWHHSEVNTFCPLCPNPRPQWKGLKQPLTPLCQRHHIVWLNYCRLRTNVDWPEFVKDVRENGEDHARQNKYKVMKAHDPILKAKVLEMLQNGRGPQYASKLTGVPISTIEKWATEGRKEGLLSAYVRPGMQHSLKASLTLNGYHKVIRRAYRGMVDADRANGRKCGFASVLECGPHFLEAGVPRPCAYCGRMPPEGQVWGLDRLDSDLGHVPGNLVPCCGSHPDGRYLSCQASKSHYPVGAWMRANMSRSLGRPASDAEVAARIDEIKGQAQLLVQAAQQSTSPRYPVRQPARAGGGHA